MKITQNFLSLGKRARSGINFTRQLTRIVIHWIGPFPKHTPAGVRNWWENGSDKRGVQASTRFIVKETECMQCLPLDEVGWHSGDARNHESIGIEVVPMNAAGEFSAVTIQTLKELVRHIRKETGRDLELVRHFDGVQKKDCPRFYTPVTNLVGVDNRVANPEGGQNRWETLVTNLNNQE